MTVTDASPGELHDQLVDIPIGDITPNPRNRNVGDVADLVASIKTLGIAEPLLVTCFDDDPDRWALIAGHRRLAAAKKAGLAEVPCIVKAGLTRGQAVELSIVENLHRTDLTPTEEADAYAQLVELGWSQRTIAERFKRSQPHVSHRLGILELPDALRARVDSGGITIETAEKLVAFKRADEKTFARYVKGNPSPSVWSIDNQLGAIKTRAKAEKLAKPYLAKGMRLLMSIPYGKWESCDEKNATAVTYDNWRDKLAFYRPKTETSPNGSTSPGTPVAPPAPKKETTKERRVRLAAEARAVARVDALRKVANSPDGAWTLIGVWMWELMEGDVEVEDLEQLLATLDLAPPIRADGAPTWDIDWADAKQRLAAYLCTDQDHARRFTIAFAATVKSWATSSAIAESLRLCAIAGYELDKHEAEKVEAWAADRAKAAEGGYESVEADACRICGCTELEPCEPPCSWVTDPNHIGPLCSTCLDLVGTVHDPDAPSGGTAIREAQLARDADFAEANDLQPGDEVLDDGTIVRADDVDVDDFEARLRGDIEKPIPARV